MKELYAGFGYQPSLCSPNFQNEANKLSAAADATPCQRYGIRRVYCENTLQVTDGAGFQETKRFSGFFFIALPGKRLSRPLKINIRKKNIL